MARTLAEIEAEIVAAKNNESTLSEFNNTSATSRWRLWVKIVALCIRTHELLWDNLLLKLEGIKASAAPGTPTWYRDQVLKYQHGHIVEIVDYRVGYATDDPLSRIVAHAAVVQMPDRTVLIKVVKDSSGTLVPLSAPELAGLGSYVEKVKFAGTRTSIVSLPADAVRFHAIIFFDPIIESTNILAEAEAAFSAYTKALPFNGAIKVSALVDLIQKIKGVTDVGGVLLETNSGAGFAPVAQEVVPLSGHFINDSLNPLSSTLTFTPYV